MIAISIDLIKQDTMHQDHKFPILSIIVGQMKTFKKTMLTSKMNPHLSYPAKHVDKKNIVQCISM